MSKSVFRWMLVVVVAILGFGTTFFHYVEKWSWLDAYYYCVVTLTTVGYGDFTPQTRLGRFGATIYIFFGVGVIAFFIQTVARRRGSEILKKRVTDKKSK